MSLFQNPVIHTVTTDRMSRIRILFVGSLTCIGQYRLQVWQRNSWRDSTGWNLRNKASQPQRDGHQGVGVGPQSFQQFLGVAKKHKKTPRVSFSWRLNMVVNVAPFFFWTFKIWWKNHPTDFQAFEFMGRFCWGFQVGTTLDFMEVDRFLEGTIPRKSAT